MNKNLKYSILLSTIFFLSSLFGGKFNIAGLPVLDFNSDKGLAYGGTFILNYKKVEEHQPYTFSFEPLVEWSTKGQRKIRIFFDSPHLILENFRFNIYYENHHDKFHPYYGQNNFSSYDKDLIDEDHETYINKRVYNYLSDKNRLYANSKFPIFNSNFFIIAGLGYNRYLNEIKEDSTKIEIDYNNGLISKKEFEGGRFYAIRTGISYDSRNNELNPSKGIWSELLLTYSPLIPGSDFEFANLLFMFNHYMTIINKDLIFAHRTMYRYSMGNEPFFSLSEFYPSYKLLEGMGGAKSIRGVFRNRLTGTEQLFTNIELRYMFYHLEIFNQNLDFQALMFTDMGIINPFYHDSTSLDHISYQEMQYYKDSKDYRIGVGLGGRVHLNKTFVAGMDAGISKEDGLRLYFSMGHLF